jgi:thiamine pyrophosphate-dependent acetolactate synthase large subunit-like protein
MSYPMGWGSDAVAELLRRLDLKYIALVPGSSYRGLHDSLVNYLGDENPHMLVCLHEEHAVAIAHGYAKVTEKPMLVALHANVGLMHASMAIFDAYCDRTPVLILGATGPVDATQRRPWIDWLHTSQDQAAIVRPYIKWDDQPGSPAAALESIMRAYQLAWTLPYGPTYVTLDVGLQEAPLPAPLAIPEIARFAPPEAPYPSPTEVERTLAILRGAKKPVLMLGRVGRGVAEWNERIALAEALNLRVVTDLRTGSTFPTEHALHAGVPSSRLGRDGVAAVREADAILSLESVDLGGMLRQAFGAERVPATIAACSIDRYVHNGWSMDHQALPPADLDIVAGADQLVRALLAALGTTVQRGAVARNGARRSRPAAAIAPAEAIEVPAFSAAVTATFAEIDTCFIRLPRLVMGKDLSFHHPLDFLGGDGGGGVGAGPGMAVGGALALRGTDRLPVAVLGDGDYLMGVTALWTAVANEIPLLVIVANNRAYFNDAAHQEHLAVQRGRPVERKWIGQRIAEPAPDLAGLARDQGAVGIGPITRPEEMAGAFAEAIAAVRAGKVAVVDVVVHQEEDVREKVAVAAHAGSRGTKP